MVAKRITYDVLLDKIDETMYGCDKKCSECCLWMENENMCYHDLQKIYNDWQMQINFDYNKYVDELLRRTK